MFSSHPGECRSSRRSEKFSIDHGEIVNPIDISSSIQKTHQQRSSRLLSTSSTSTYSSKMCIQLQITISLLSISICFIFCTLPNCISTIMIQTYNQNEQRRKFWQAMNYFSIVPLLITHSVNLIFYYLSSNMFRNRLKENYFQRKSLSNQRVSIR